MQVFRSRICIIQAPQSHCAVLGCGRCSRLTLWYLGLRYVCDGQLCHVVGSVHACDLQESSEEEGDEAGTGAGVTSDMLRAVTGKLTQVG